MDERNNATTSLALQIPTNACTREILWYDTGEKFLKTLFINQNRNGKNKLLSKHQTAPGNVTQEKYGRQYARLKKTSLDIIANQDDYHEETQRHACNHWSR
jgi:hypothetical protein